MRLSFGGLGYGSLVCESPPGAFNEDFFTDVRL